MPDDITPFSFLNLNVDLILGYQAVTIAHETKGKPVLRDASSGNNTTRNQSLTVVGEGLNDCFSC